jgi:hypothetical protein
MTKAFGNQAFKAALALLASMEYSKIPLLEFFLYLDNLESSRGTLPSFVTKKSIEL